MTVEQAAPVGQGAGKGPEAPASQRNGSHVDADPNPLWASDEAPSTLNLVSRLCQALDAEDIKYCHWKSNNALDRTAVGDNDLDLLVFNEHAQRFTEILCRLGFKLAQPRPEKRVPSVFNYYGFDEQSGRLVHVHAHFRLVMGDDRTKNYHLPIEKAYLASRNEKLVQNVRWQIPAPEFEFIVLVIRMVLKHCSWDAILGGKGKLSRFERAELEDLQARIKRSQVNQILSNHLPCLNDALFARCLQSVQPGASLWRRISTAGKLQKALDAHTCRGYWSNVCLKAWRRIAQPFRRRLRRNASRKRLATGGMVIALVGGDGAGKSTAVESLNKWLAGPLATRKFHLGKPKRSWTTQLVRGILKIAKLCGLGRSRKLLQEVCKARDRYLAYVKVRRIANNGDIVICDRFPLAPIKCMDCAQVENLARQYRANLAAGHGANLLRSALRFLSQLEKSYYRRILLPELVLVLKLDPEVAVRRKTDEDSNSVRARSTGIWNLNGAELDAHVIDASGSKEQVLAEIKQLVWSAI